MEAASIAQHCKTLRLSSIGTQFASLAEEASKQNHSHLHYLEALLQAEVEDRERREVKRESLASETGLSFHQWRTLARLMAAVRLLSEGASGNHCHTVFGL